MRYSTLKYIASFLMFASCHVANANPFDTLLADYQRVRAEGRASHIVDIDNDSLLLNRDDGFYTSGLRYTLLQTARDAERVTTFGWRIGQELYTASDIKIPAQRVGPPDRPYAGWLYGGIYKEVVRSDGSHARFGLDIGCLGPCAGGEWTQRTLHRMLDQPLPQGWSRQMRNEFGVVLHANVAPVRWTLSPSVDVTPSLNARLGNIFTDAGASVLLRAGDLNMLPGQSTLHAFLRADIRAIAYNATLQGGYFSKGNPHTVSPKRVVGEAEIGVVWNSAPFGVKLGFVRRGNEVDDLPNSSGAQNFLRLQFSYAP